MIYWKYHDDMLANLQQYLFTYFHILNRYRSDNTNKSE